MIVSKVLEILEENNLLVDKNIDNIEKIEYLSYNSKDVRQNTMFFCKGIHFKREYLTSAKEKGAIIYISDKKYDIDLPYIIVNDIQKALAYLSNAFYDNPASKITLIGITGTKGKTTVASFINSILNEYTNKKTAILSSIVNYTGIKEEVSKLTTPESLELNKYFNEAYENGCEYLTMEVSSQGYKTDRVLGINYDYALFLNIGYDHISDLEHPDFEDYFNCKLKLMKNCKTAVINKNTDVFDRVYNECSAKNIITYGIDESADYYYSNIKKDNDGFTFDVISLKNDYKETFKINMAGRFNIENALAAITLTKQIGVDDKSIKNGLLKTKVSGRMNIFEKNGMTIIVDYAHNKLSYTKLFDSIKQDYPNRRIVSVGGCDGSRAYNRRKEYADCVNEYADYVYLTECDPQYEKVEDICDDIIKYFNKDIKYEVIVDRKTAIEKAIKNAKENDVIAITAKAGEKYQKVNGMQVPYESDLVIVENVLSEIK